jgi:putative adenylate-forming enzyme
LKFKLYILFYLILFLARRDHRKSRSQLNKVKSRRLKILLRHLKNSPFYKFSASQNSLEAFPVINKEVFMQNFDEINTRGIKKADAFKLANEAEKSRDFSATLNGITVGLSTGTSGNKGLFLAGEKERAKWVAAVIHRVIGISLRPRKIAFFLRANSKLYESANSCLLHFNFFDLMNDHESNFKRLANLDADILVAQPSALLKIASSFIESRTTPAFEKVISVAEVLNDIDRAYLEKVFRLTLDEVYQCTEGFLACSCKCGNLHFNEDYIMLEKEYIDKEHKRYHPVITDLYRQIQPIIRYKLDDILVEGDACTCGNRFEVINRIEGRAEDVIRLTDRSGILIDIYPDYFSRAITTASDEITDYILTQTGKDMMEIYMNTVSGEIQQTVRNNIIELLSKFNIEPAVIHFTTKKEKDQRSKLRRIRNEYYKKMQDNRNR